MIKCSRILIAILLIALTHVAGFAQEYQNWKYVNPHPLANEIQDIQMFDANTWYAVGSGGTFMKTTNAGQTWYFHHKAGLVGADSSTTGTAALYFTDVNHGIVVGDKGYIGKTTDGGVSFTQVGIGVIPSTQGIRRLWIANSSVGYVAAMTGSGFAGTIAKTTDGGYTWSVVYTSTSEAVTAIGGSSPLVVYAALADGTMLSSIDGGANWSVNAGAVGQYMYTMAFIDSLNGLVAGSQGQVYRTTNAGQTWDTTTHVGTSDDVYFKIKIIDRTKIYLVGNPYYLYKTSDFGNTWSYDILNVNGPAVTFMWYGMSFYGSNYTVCGDFGVVARSTDAGSSWSSTNNIMNDNIIFDIQAIKGTKKVIAAGRQFYNGDKQIYKSTDGGTTWATRDLGVNTDAYALSMINENVGYVCGTNGTVMKTTNGGDSWTVVTSPTGGTGSLYSMKFINENTGWVFLNYSFSAPNIYKTTDGGNTWTPQSAGSTAIAGASMVDANTGYVCMNPSNQPIYKTTDGGTTWTAVVTPLKSNITDIKALDANTVYIVQSYGTYRVAKTTDGGANWTTISLPVSVDLHSVDFKDINNGYVAGNTTATVLHTTDGGTTWDYDNLHMPTLVKVRYGNTDTVFAMGTYGSIFCNVSDQSSSMGLSVAAASGWNILSSPYIAANMAVTNLYPGANSPAYGYANGYVITDTMKTGQGYWLRFPSAQQFTLSGNSLSPFTINLNQGWNLIGAREASVSTSSISTNPAGILNSVFYGYNNGYQSVTTLNPGQGYWIRASQSGTMTLNNSSGNTKLFFSIDLNNAGCLTITDAANNSGKLYLTNDPVDAAVAALPPVPPGNAFDARFSDNSYISSFISGAAQTLRITAERYPITITAGNISLSIKDKATGKIIDQVLHNGSSITIDNSSVQIFEIQKTNDLPMEFALHQNYPNPFNPSTTINYTLPVAGQVSVKIYDVLGKEIMTLVNEKKDAGTYSVVFNANNLPSGIYICRLNTPGFSKTMKMTLMK